MSLPRYLTVVAALILTCAADRGAAQTTSANTFRVFFRGADIGIDEVAVLESPAGWTLRGSTKLRGPLSLAVDFWEARYDRAWKPLELTVNLTETANRWVVHSTFSGTTASTDISQNGQTQRRTHTIAADTIVLPNLIFGTYEALAARLASAQPGAELQAYIAPQDVLPVVVHAVTNETIQVPGRTIAARRWTLRVGADTPALEMDVWTDGPRLLRLDIPAQMLTVMRDDIASVSARLVTMARPNDEQVAIPANGFSLAATISKPATAAEPAPAAGRKVQPVRLPVVVLVSGSSPSDRDEIVAGVPIFAHLANAIADAGYLVVRYDERGSGQSGGRSESASLEEFALDARAVVDFLGRRRDVDPKRIALVGYGEGGWIAMLVAAREQKVAAVGLVATPSISGADLVLEQQRIAFEGGVKSPIGQEAAVEQQKKIINAVVTGKGLDTLHADVRRRVDSPLYRSFLTFDPTATITRVRQPMLVVQPMLDREIPAYHGEQLAQLARSRPRAKTTDFVQLEGVNHLLARATTGTVAEYSVLAQRSVSPAATLEITAWLNKSLPAPASR